MQPRKTHPCLTERLLMGRKESNKQDRLHCIKNKTKPTNSILHFLEKELPLWLETYLYFLDVMHFQGSHRFEKYLNIVGFLEKSDK